MLQAMRQGASARAAALASGIPERTWYSWAQAARDGRWPDGGVVQPDTLVSLRALADDIARIQGEVEAKCQQTLFAAGDLAVGERDWRAHHEYLKHGDATRARWHEHRELKITQSGSVAHEHRLVRDLEDTQLIELLPPDIAGLLTGPDAA